MSLHNFRQPFTRQFVKLGANRAKFQQIYLSAGKEKACVYIGLRDFGGYEKMEKVSTGNTNFSFIVGAIRK